MRVRRSGSVILAMVLLCGVSAPALAESLAEALVMAYKGNPSLRAERARQRATDEQIPQALSGWRPTIEAQGEIGYQYRDTDNAQGFFANNEPSNTTPATLSIALSQPLFRGFRTVEGTKQAEATVRAGKNNLIAVEQQVLFNAAQSYLDVVRDRRTVELRRANVRVLRQQLAAAQARFDVGEVTRTDVSQSRARLSASEAALANAQATLTASTASYTRFVGHAPGKLKQPKLTRIPKSLKEALAIGEKNHPNIKAAVNFEQAATHAVEVTKGDLLPELSIQARGTQAWNDLDAGKNENTGTQTQVFSLQGVLNVPLYEGGRTYAAVRQQKQVASQRRIQVIESTRQVREAVMQSWAFIDSGRERIAAARAQVSAFALALDGVKQEYLVGSRTTLDVLNAEQELTNAKVELVNAEHDLLIAGYQLVASIGNLTTDKLGLNVTRYDPNRNTNAARKKWIGLEAETIK